MLVGGNLVALAVVETCEGGDGVGGVHAAGTDALGEVGFAPGLDFWMLVKGLLDLEETRGRLGRDQTLSLRESLNQADHSSRTKICQRDLVTKEGGW